MNEQELRDTRYVWHCRNRRTNNCPQSCYYCKGTSCKSYIPNKGSYHDLYPIKTLIQKGVK